jgi:predicted P-loop ATPase
MMISAVARIVQPGCKVDTVLTLEGGQGKKKSSAIERLFGKQWFTDNLAELDTKDAAMQLAGVWCIEIADLAAMKRADQDKIEAFITRKRDRFRPPYGRNVIEQERASIFIAMTNLDDWTKDETGGRRFWPVHSEATIDFDEIAALRDQLWTEAVECYRADEHWWFTDDEAELAREELPTRYVGDPWDTPISRPSKIATQ